MTQEEKDLLLTDLCTRLKYGVKFTLSSNNIYTMKGIDLIVTDDGDWEYAVTAKGIEPIGIEYIKPYLRPMSSMTEEEENEIRKDYWFWIGINNSISLSYHSEGYWDDDLKTNSNDYLDLFDWLNSHHFDYRGLIEKGLALEALEGMYK